MGEIINVPLHSTLGGAQFTGGKFVVAHQDDDGDYTIRIGSSYCTRADLAAIHAAMGDVLGVDARWRHVQRGTEYAEVARAELQDATGWVVEGCTLVIYRGKDGKCWARKDSEFEDGRFERIAP